MAKMSTTRWGDWNNGWANLANFPAATAVRGGGGGGGGAATAVAPDKINKMRITPLGQSGGLTLPFAPQEVNATNLSDSWTEVARTGLPPLVIKESEGVDHLSFTLFLGSRDPDAPVTSIIDTLKRYAKTKTPLLVQYSSFEEGLWHIASLSVTSALRRPDHEVTRATADVELVRSSTAMTGAGPVSGGVGAGASGGGRNTGDPNEGVRTTIYPVRKGDTLHSIAIFFYRDQSRWKDIAKWNKIDDPKDLKTGQRLEIRNPTRTAHADG